MGSLQEAMPDRASLQLKEVVTVALFQPAALASGLRLALMLGAVLSMLSPALVALAVLPALSLASPLRLWSRPSVLTRAGGEQVSTPERASPQLQLTVT